MKGIDIGCMLCTHGKGENEHEDCVSCIRCIGRDLTDPEGFSDNFKPAALALPERTKIAEYRIAYGGRLNGVGVDMNMHPVATRKVLCVWGQATAHDLRRTSSGW